MVFGRFPLVSQMLFLTRLNGPMQMVRYQGSVNFARTGDGPVYERFSRPLLMLYSLHPYRKPYFTGLFEKRKY